MAWTPRDTSTGSFEDYLYNAVNQVAGAVGEDTSHSNYTLWQNAEDDTRENMYNLALAQMQNDWQKQENLLAFQRNKQLIDEQNAYNSPANQMARYMEAGLNPNVIYGQISSGNQSGTANYQPATMHAPTFKSDKYAKLNKALDVMNTLASIVGQGAQLAGQIEGVKNQSLQNQILEETMPQRISELQYAGDLATLRRQYFNENMIDWSDSLGRYVIKPGYEDAYRDIVFPEVTKSAGVRAKTNYQNWWNSEIAPIYKNQLEGKSLSAEEQAKMDQYNREQLESFPPIVRPFVWLLTQMFGMIK